MGILIRELGILYTAILKNQPDPLPPLTIQYPDYAIWQRNWVSGERLEAQTNYWKEALSGAPTLLELPTDYPRPTEQDYTGAAIDAVLDDALTAQLKKLSQHHGITLFMTLLTSWSILLSRLSGQKDVVVGTPSANRGRQEIEELIGFFVNTLAIRIDQSDNPTVAQLLERVKTQALVAQAHQDIPFEQIVEILQPPRSLSYSPLFQVMFAWQNTPKEKFELPGITFSTFETSNTSAQFDLSLSLGEVDNHIEGEIIYANSLFKPDTVNRILNYWRTLLTSMVADDNQNVEQIPILPKSERQIVLYDWNATDTDYPKDKCIHELFEEQVTKTPDAVAVIYEDQQLTYAELNSKSNQLAHYLRSLGVRPDSLVGICVERGLNMMIG
jgi:non-ribosomal peptide synthetase component F